MNKLPEQIIIDIIKNQMGLSSSQCWIGFQNKLIPPSSGLWVVVNNVDSKVLSVTNSPVTNGVGVSDLNQTVMRENIQIDILSRDTSAITRRAEILLALASTYSKQQQEDQEFSIFRIPSTFVNTSGAEGGSNINRFTIIVACHTWYRNQKVLQSPDYYDNFNARVDDAQTIDETEGLIEFNIHGDDVS